MTKVGLVCAALIVLAGLTRVSRASAAVLTWDRDVGAQRCASNEALEGQAEARLGRPLSALPSARGIRVQLQRRESGWVIRLEMRDDAGNIQGDRVLSVPGVDCAKMEPYVALALALMIDPNAALDLGAEDAAEPVIPEPPPSTPTVPAKLPPAPEPPVREVVDARISGEGRSVIYVYPAVPPAEHGPGWPRALEPEPVARLAQRLLSQRFVEREVYTVVEPGELLAKRSEADALARKAARRGSPAVRSQGKAPPPARYVLVPSLDELTVQDGFDYSLGGDGRAVTVNLHVSVFVTDVAGRRQLPEFEVKTAFSLRGRRKDAATVRFAVKLALEKAADEVLSELRVVPAFRIRPRFVAGPDGDRAALTSLRGVKDGDRFEFEDESGERSGFASVYEVGATQARVRVWKQGSGRLMSIGAAQPLVLSVALKSVHRLAFASPGAEETARAKNEGVMPRHFDGGTELGMMYRLAWESSSGSRLRPLVDLGWSFAVVHSLALNTEARGGLGYQLSLPALGLGLMPYLSAGLLYMRGSMGSNEDGGGKLEGLLGLTGNAGATLELFRLFGGVSLAATGEAQYVLPVASMTSADDFLDHERPALHALSLQLGITYRPSEFPN